MNLLEKSLRIVLTLALVNCVLVSTLVCSLLVYQLNFAHTSRGLLL